MLLRLAICSLLVACGGSSGSAPDAPTDTSDAAEPDASIDAAVADAPDPLLGPPDPVSTVPCSGILGFPALPTLATESYYPNIELTDVDGDGHLDAVVGELSSIVIARGAGDGTFAQAPAYSTARPLNASIVRAADLTGDGKAELVIFAPGELTIVPNTGSGFGSVSTVPLALAAIELEVTDVDGNGRRDILALAYDGTVAVLLDDGATFQPAVTYSAGTINTGQMVVGDVTGDARPDIVASNWNAGTVSVLANAGNGTFAARVTYPVDSPWAIALADMNEDTRLDVVVTSEAASAPVVSILLNTAGGTLAAPTHTSAGATGQRAHRALAIADLNLDGHADVVVAKAFGTQLSGAIAFSGTGTGALGEGHRFASDVEASTLAVGDVTSDGRADVMVSIGTHLALFAHTGTAEQFVERSRYQFGRPLQTPGRVHVADFDGNGALDVMAFFSTLPTYDAVRRMGDGTGALAPAAVDAVPMRVGGSQLRDFNQDGRMDVLAIGSEDGATLGARVLFANTAGELAPGPFSAGPGAIADHAIADLNHDGLLDLVAVGNESTVSLNVHRGLSGGLFGPAEHVFTVGSPGGATIAVTDLNTDGHPDLVLGTYEEGGAFLRTFLGNGTTGFLIPTTSETSDLGALSAHDVDGDGRRDIVETSIFWVAVRKNLGTGLLGPPIVTPSPRMETGAAFGDLDGDGHVDIVRGAFNAIAIQRGNGDGTFGPAVFYESGQVPSYIPPSIGDLDHDGQLDIITGNNGDRFSVLYGRCR